MVNVQTKRTGLRCAVLIICYTFGFHYYGYDYIITAAFLVGPKFTIINRSIDKNVVGRDPLSILLNVYHVNDVDEGKETTESVIVSMDRNYSTNNDAAVVASLKIVDTVQLGTVSVPQVGVGTISWSADTVSNRHELEKLVATGLQHSSGLFLDTAERYGSNMKTAFGLGWGETERLTYELLYKNTKKTTKMVTTKNSKFNEDNTNVVVATKFTPSPWRTTSHSVVEACQESRRRILGKNADRPLDLYQLHMPDIVQPMAKLLGPYSIAGQSLTNTKDKIYWDGLAECYHQGLIKNVGVCNYGPTLLLQCQEHLSRRGVPLASNQIAYSVIGRHDGAQKTLDIGKEMGIQTLTFFPFAMGLLTGKYNTNNNNIKDYKQQKKSSSSLVNSKRSKLEEYDLYRYAIGDGDSIPKGGIKKVLKVMEEIAINHNRTIAQVALNYIICQGGIPIPGARTNEQYLDNIGAMGWRLTINEIDQLTEVSDQLGFGFDGAGFKRTSEKFVGYGVEKWTLN